MSRKFSKELGRSLVVEASQTGAIVAGDEGVEAGIAFGMAEKAAVGWSISRSRNQHTARHSRARSRQSSETKHAGREDQKQCTR